MTSGDVQRATLADLSSQQAADKLAIRRRDAAGQMALFTEDTDFLVYTDSRDPTPTQHLRGRQALAPVFAELNTFVNLSGLWYFSQRKLMVDWTETRSLNPA